MAFVGWQPSGKRKGTYENWYQAVRKKMLDWVAYLRVMIDDPETRTDWRKFVFTSMLKRVWWK
jgi:hypothetical protein